MTQTDVSDRAKTIFTLLHPHRGNPEIMQRINALCVNKTGKKMADFITNGASIDEKVALLDEIKGIVEAQAWDKLPPAASGQAAQMAVSSTAVPRLITPKSTKSWLVEVSTDNGKSWGGNALRFATAAEAEKWAQDLMGRWLAATNYKITPSDDEVKDAKPASMVLPNPVKPEPVKSEPKPEPAKPEPDRPDLAKVPIPEEDDDEAKQIADIITRLVRKPTVAVDVEAITKEVERQVYLSIRKKLSAMFVKMADEILDSEIDSES